MWEVHIDIYRYIVLIFILDQIKNHAFTTGTYPVSVPTVILGLWSNTNLFFVYKGGDIYL